eukprot:3531309-Lingulodinium_polyedra.AAC.1
MGYLAFTRQTRWSSVPTERCWSAPEHYWMGLVSPCASGPMVFATSHSWVVASARAGERPRGNKCTAK